MISSQFLAYLTHHRSFDIDAYDLFFDLALVTLLFISFSANFLGSFSFFFFFFQSDRDGLLITHPNTGQTRDIVQTEGL